MFTLFQFTLIEITWPRGYFTLNKSKVLKLMKNPNILYLQLFLGKLNKSWHDEILQEMNVKTIDLGLSSPFSENQCLHFWLCSRKSPETPSHSEHLFTGADPSDRIKHLLYRFGECFIVNDQNYYLLTWLITFTNAMY